MPINKCNLLALAITAAISQNLYAAEDDSKDPGLTEATSASSQASANGFFEDADLLLENRNVAFYQNALNTEPGTQNYQSEWGQAAMLTFTSGYTQGLVGFGVDAFANGAVRLNSGAGTGGSPVLPANGSRCDAVTGSCIGQESYGLAGGAVKARISETEIKAGDLRPNSPVFGTWDGYLMPQHANGGMFSSNEIENLALQGGHFTSGTADNSTNRDGNLGTTYGVTRVDSADYLGGDYTFSDSLTFGLHAAKYEDVWNQYYADLYHFWGLSDDTSLLTSLAWYKTADTGDADAGDIDTNAYSAALALTHGAHTVTFAHQKVNGDTPFDYLGVSGFSGADNKGQLYNPAGSIWLANSSQFADFNSPNLASYKLQYDLDGAAFGIPGLAFMTRYVRGTGGDGSKADVNGVYAFYADMHDGKEWERDVQVSYVVQDGAAKDLSFTLRQATYRGNSDANLNSGKDVDEVRLITSYPLDIL